MEKSECLKVETFLRRTFRLDTIDVRRRPQKKDSAEVYLGEEFIGVVFRDDEDDEVSYSFQMAILDIDLK